MLNPFFKNIGPFNIEKLLLKAEIENIKNFKKDKIYNVSDLVGATNKDLTFFHSKNYSLLASKTKASYCVTLESLAQFFPQLYQNCLFDLFSSHFPSFSSPFHRFLDGF